MTARDADRPPPFVPPPAELELPRGAVHVWSADVAGAPADLAELRSDLDADERERAERFHFEADRRRYVVAHAALRRILGATLGVAPRSLAFRTGERGKPALAAPASAARAVELNLSHSGDQVLVAVARGAAVGVDVERIRPDVAVDDLARRFFAPEEVEALARLPAEERRRAFFRCWTRKEALLKGLGTGLARALDRFAVSLAPGEPARVLKTDWDPAEAGRWRLHTLAPAAGHAAALAVRASDAALSCWRYSHAGGPPPGAGGRGAG